MPFVGDEGELALNGSGIAVLVSFPSLVPIVPRAVFRPYFLSFRGWKTFHSGKGLFTSMPSASISFSRLRAHISARRLAPLTLGWR